MCDCGCGTIGFAVDPGKAEPAPSPRWRDGPDIIAEGNTSAWLMLFQQDGWLLELEHVPGYPPGALEDLAPDTIAVSSEVEDDWFE